MKLADLITDHAGKHMSHTKVWNNLASAVVSGVVVWQAYKGTLSDDLVLWYLAILGGSAALSKGIGFSYGKGKSE
jgi:hypothetical protein